MRLQRDVERKGIYRKYLKRLEEQGLLVRSARGVYTDAPEWAPLRVIQAISGHRSLNQLQNFLSWEQVVLNIT
ncbi:hypothetical protein NUACC21_56320 [Scytonema sp. NUACC21]